MTPHTQAKHLILRRHLDAWLPIMTAQFPSLLFVDGFAGPGSYERGEPGSPLIAIRAAALNRRLRERARPSQVKMWFIEEKADRAAALRDELRRFESEHPLPVWLKYKVERGEFEPCMTRVLDERDEVGKSLPPTFVFVDPFGYSGVPMELIARIARIPSSECLINFAYESINRFGGHGDAAKEAHIDGLFGTPEWRKCWPEERRLVALYEQQLRRQCGFRYIRCFKMRDTGGQTQYFLAFATNSPRGLSVMKQAMWKADPHTGQVFSDGSDPGQLMLIDLLPPLRDLLRQRFRGRGFIPIHDLVWFVLIETDYAETHLRERTLVPMEQETPPTIEVQRPPGKRRGSFTPGTRIRFL
jgi:three-Cys-motif partner protein